MRVMADMILRLRNWASPRRMGVLRPGIMGVPPSLLYFFFLLIFIMSFFRNTSRACVSNPDSRNNPRQKYMYLSRHLYLMALLFIFPIFVSGSAHSLSHASSSLPDYLTHIVTLLAAIQSILFQTVCHILAVTVHPSHDSPVVDLHLPIVLVNTLDKDSLIDYHPSTQR